MRVARGIATFLVGKRGDKVSLTGQDDSQTAVKVSDRERNLIQSLNACRETVTLCMSSSADCRVNQLQNSRPGEVSYGRFTFQEEFMGTSLVVPTILVVVALCAALVLRFFKAMRFSRRRIAKKLMKKDLKKHHHDLDALSASSGNGVLSRVTWIACQNNHDLD